MYQLLTRIWHEGGVSFEPRLQIRAGHQPRLGRRRRDGQAR